MLQSPNESIPGVLKKLGDAVGEAITSADIEVCHRVNTRDRKNTNIIVQFQRRSKHDQVLEKARKKQLTNNHLGLTSSEESPEDQPIYINEHLCPHLMKLLGKTTARRHECGWKYAWSKNGSIYARRTDTSPVLLVKRESDLDKIMA